MVHTIKKWIAVIIMTIVSFSAKAQTTDFSGTWLLSHQQSIPKDSWEMVDELNIVQQNDQLIMTWFAVKDGTKTLTAKDTLVIDEKGNEYTHQRQDGRIDKTIIKRVWSPDRKSLIITTKMYLDDKENIGFKTVYELSNDGSTLRMLTSDSGNKYAVNNIGVFSKQ